MQNEKFLISENSFAMHWERFTFDVIKNSMNQQMRYDWKQSKVLVEKLEN